MLGANFHIPGEHMMNTKIHVEPSILRILWRERERDREEKQETRKGEEGEGQKHNNRERKTQRMGECIYKGSGFFHLKMRSVGAYAS